MTSNDPGPPAGGIDAGVATARVGRLVCAALASAAGLGLLGLSIFALSTLRAHVDSISSGGDDGFDAIVTRMRVVGMGFLSIALCLLRTGGSLDARVSAIASAWGASCRRAPRALVCSARSDPSAAVGLGAIVVAGIGLRLSYVNVPLRYDEATTWFSYVSKPLYVGLSNYSAPNDHLLNTALAKLSVTLLGDGPTALRLPALLAGIGAIPVAYALGRVLYGRSAALLAAGLVAASSTLVEYSANARGYALVALLTVLSLLAAAHVVEDDDLPSWAAMGLVLALGLYAVPTMAYAACGVLGWILVSQVAAGRDATRALTRTGACAAWIAALAVVMYAPVLVASGPRALTSNEFVTSLPIAEFLGRLPGHVADTAGTWARDLPPVVAVSLAILLVISVLLTPVLSTFPIPPLAMVVGASGIMLVLQRAIPFTRVWLFVVPVAAVTIAGLPGHVLDRWQLPRRGAPVLAFLIALAGALTVLAADSPRTSRETGALLDAPAVARYLAGAATPSDRILATGSDTILAYYLHREKFGAESSLFATSPRRHTYVVVNTLGHQTLDGVLADLGEPRNRYGPVRLLRRWDSASVYLLGRR